MDAGGQKTPDRTTASGVPGALQRPHFLDPLPISIFLALVFTVAGLVELLTRSHVAAGSHADNGLLIALTVATTLTLSFLWLSPFAALTAGMAMLSLQSALHYDVALACIVAVVLASFATVGFDRGRYAVAGGFVVAAGLVVIFLTLPGVTWQRALLTWLTFSVVWAVAGTIRLYRTSAARAERRAALFAGDREARAREAVADERARLARELHDSVGHALNVVVLHAGAGKRVMETRPELALEALVNIETAGRQALGDIERMLGILRAPDEATGLDAQPGIAQVALLCEQVREAGLPVKLTVTGEERPLPSSLDLTAYRIVQEALTNTLKHAGDTRARVDLTYGPGALAIDVEDDGRGAAVVTHGGGRGLAGMRERVAIFGGELEAGPRAEGGFAVRARLPLGQTRS